MKATAHRTTGIRGLVRRCVWLGVVLAAARLGVAQWTGPVELDHVLAVVNGELIFASQVDEERRFEVFQPLREMTKKPTDDELLERLIDRTLILQQAKMQPEEPIPEEQVEAEIAALRKNIPECQPDRCATDAEWTRFMQTHGFTPDDVLDRWRERMEMLRFIEERFRMGIRISQVEIDDYYKKTLVPAFVERGATAPAEDTVSARVQEILLQQQVNKLLEDWLQTLRAQGTVRVVKPGEAMP
jgi:peptidyl-prolyl cis-trans isomerase SurA